MLQLSVDLAQPVHSINLTPSSSHSTAQQTVFCYCRIWRKSSHIKDHTQRVAVPLAASISDASNT